MIDAKPLHIRFDKIDGFIRIYDGTRYLVLPGLEKYDIYNKIRYLKSIKNGITYIFSHYYAKFKVDSYDSLLIEKILTLQNVIILIKSFLNKDKNHYYYNTVLEKCLYQLVKQQSKHFFDSIIVLRFGETKIANEIFYAAKKIINIWDFNIDNIVISKLIETKTTSKYLIGHLDIVIRPLVLVMPKMSGYVKTVKVKDRDKDKNNKFMSFCIDDEKLLKNTKVFGLKLKT